MATINNLVNLLDDYVAGRRWVWGKCDCIGLLFHVVNNYTGKNLNRNDYIPDMPYDESVRWLIANHPDPLEPYKRMLADAEMSAQEYKLGAQVTLVNGGGPIVSKDGEEYPIDVVPGVIFQTRWGTEYALLRSGLRVVVVYDSQVRRILRYGLNGAY